MGTVNSKKKDKKKTGSRKKQVKSGQDKEESGRQGKTGKW